MNKLDRRMSLVSICIPAYNEEKYIKRCLESILKQSYQNIEVVILDDASIDSTSKIINSYKDDRIVYVRNDKNLGWRLNVKKCYEVASGSFITILPADDFLHEDFVDSAMNIFSKYHNVGIWSCGCTSIDENNLIIGSSYASKIGIIKSDMFFRYIYSMRDVSAPAQTMIRRSNFNAVNGYSCYSDSKYQQFPEINLYLKIANIGFDAYQCKELLSLRTWRVNSLTGIFGNCSFLIEDNYNILYEHSDNVFLNKDLVFQTNEYIAFSVIAKMKNNLKLLNASEIIRLFKIFSSNDIIIRNRLLIFKIQRFSYLIIKYIFRKRDSIVKNQGVMSIILYYTII